MDKYFTWFKRVLISILILASCGYAALFCIKNNTIVDIDLFFIQLTGVKLELAMVASFIVGGIAGLLSSVSLLLAIRRKYRRQLKLQKKSMQVQTS